MMLVDSIYSGSNYGYGSWLQKITSGGYQLSTGKTSAMSGYGENSHWGWDNGTKMCPPTINKAHLLFSHLCMILLN